MGFIVIRNVIVHKVSLDGFRYIKNSKRPDFWQNDSKERRVDIQISKWSSVLQRGQVQANFDR